VSYQEIIGENKMHRKEQTLAEALAYHPSRNSLGIAFVTLKIINSRGQWHSGSTHIRATDLVGRRYESHWNSHSRMIIVKLLDCVFDTKLWLYPGLRREMLIRYRGRKRNKSFINRFRKSRLYASFNDRTNWLSNIRKGRTGNENLPEV
jgi:hypothetical protein